VKIRSVPLRQKAADQNAVSLKEEFVYSGIDEPVCMMIPAGQANAGTNPKRLLTPLFF
jgi:hypothetical protein